MKTDIQIAREAQKSHIKDIAAKLAIPESELQQYGHDKAKLSQQFIESLADEKEGKLILVTAVSPTPAGEGKTTTSVGLTDALNKIGKKTVVCLREPSLGPCFGMKGGAAGGGYAQVIPMEDINLHFTGDLHAISAAHNLLAAMIDNHINWGNELGIDVRRIAFKRVVDMNDRALRNIVASMGGVGNGYPRETGFDITVASEIMAIFCLATSLQDLQTRLGNIIIGYTPEQKPITARELNADGAMTVLLKDAFMPNLVQTLENNPAFIHGGPFANIAHGCNSVIATKTALKLADYVVTEAGFGADLGAEKFFNIKCRKAKLKPQVVVIVATVRALKMHGGISKDELSIENIDAVRKGSSNLVRHISNVKKFGVPIVVAVNHFVNDSDAEIDAIRTAAEEQGVETITSKHWVDGSEGAIDLAKKVVEIVEGHRAQFAPLYPDNMPLFEKIKTVATSIYGASDITANMKIRNQLRAWQSAGFGHLPVCIAKTQYSFSTDPKLLGAPSGHVVPIREVRLSAGAEFIVVICGAIMTMPGLPRTPAANHIRLDKNGLVEGLF
ncbi:MAG: formate--tetrahydrofolate ligase [Gammaproteobacteria bacterium]|nr:MAG: formate--tetrahydrofolate ligase [Gammaproteobacteria bacterium]